MLENRNKNQWAIGHGLRSEGVSNVLKVEAESKVETEKGTLLSSSVLENFSNCYFTFYVMNSKAYQYPIYK